MTASSVLFIAAGLCCFAGMAAFEARRAARLRRNRLAWLLRDANNEAGGWTQVYLALSRQLVRFESIAVIAAGLLALVAGGLLGLHVLLTLAGALAACPAAWFGARYWRLMKIRKLFADRFPDAVDNLTRAVQAGIPIERALAAIGENYEGELGKRFTLMVRHLELGVPFREAAATFSDSLNMPDVDFFCAVLALNRESGSRLSPMLISLSRTLRERRAVGRKLKVLTSETRSSAKVLTLLPCVVLSLQFLLNPKQFEFLFHDPTGRFILGICLACMAAGIFIINRMSRMGGAE